MRERHFNSLIILVAYIGGMVVPAAIVSFLVLVGGPTTLVVSFHVGRPLSQARIVSYIVKQTNLSRYGAQTNCKAHPHHDVLPICSPKGWNNHPPYEKFYIWQIKGKMSSSALSAAGGDVDADSSNDETKDKVGRKKISVSLLNKVSSKKIARNVAGRGNSTTKKGGTSKNVMKASKDGVETRAKKMLAETAQRLAAMEAAHQEKLSQTKMMNEEQKKSKEVEKEEESFSSSSSSSSTTQIEEERQRLIEQYSKYSANALKAILDRRKVSMKKGRKPDLAKRIADLDIMMKYPNNSGSSSSKMMNFRDDIETERVPQDEMLTTTSTSTPGGATSSVSSINEMDVFQSFAGISPLSATAGRALCQAKFRQPSPIQKSAIPAIYHDEESVILHAETGSGKTLAYLLPITERIWSEATTSGQLNNEDIALIMTPTRELATQVAAVATVLAPPGSVRLITKPTNLMQEGGDQSDMFIDEAHGGRISSGGKPRIFVGSAKSIQYSLYGDGKMPAAPTPKPLAMQFLQSVRWTVLDEVDRLLNVKQTSGSGGGYGELSAGGGRGVSKKSPKHEKPAAIVTAAVMRFTMGQCQVIAASATIGRPLRRELSRVLGVSPQECPRVVRGEEDDGTPSNSEEDGSSTSSTTSDRHIGRAVTIPKTVKNYIYVVQGKDDGAIISPGALLVTAANISKALPAKEKSLLVLSRRSGLKVSTTVGALQHFGATPQPKALLDALMGGDEGKINNNIVETPTGMISQYQHITGSNGVGATDDNDDGKSSSSSPSSYLLVTGEDSIRGLHLEGLDTVIVVGRTEGPDEYSHVAGRTGRAGRVGRVINIMSSEDASKTKSWEKMLMVNFDILENVNDLEDVRKVSR